MTINRAAWSKYIGSLRKLNDAATEKMLAFITRVGWVPGNDTRILIDYAYSLSTKYGEAAAALACEMYDAVALASGKILPAAAPAETATYAEVARAINGTAKTNNYEIMSSAVGRQVKMAGVDTTMQNAIRDHAEWAWIPSGDSCAFCEMLASNGWLPASKAQMDGDHAEHIHANCDCTFAIRFNSDTDVQGYNPSVYKRIYDDADGITWEQKVNAIRREQYAENKDKINEQKREAYAKRQEREEEEE